MSADISADIQCTHGVSMTMPCEACAKAEADRRAETDRLKAEVSRLLEELQYLVWEPCDCGCPGRSAPRSKEAVDVIYRWAATGRNHLQRDGGPAQTREEFTTQTAIYRSAQKHDD